MKQIFYDPQRKRWKRLRRFLDVSALLLTVILIIFVISAVNSASLPGLLLPTLKRNYRALPTAERQADLRRALQKTAHQRRRHLKRRPSDVVLNQDQSVRAAFYENDQESYSSLKAHIHQIDLLFPDWLHVTGANGNLRGATSEYPVQFFRVVDSSGVHPVDPQQKVQHVIAAAKENTEIFPMLNDYDGQHQAWDGEDAAKMLQSPSARHRLQVQLDKFLAANPNYHGLCLDLEALPDQDQKLYADWIADIYHDLHAKNLRVYVTVAVGMPSALLRQISRNSDGVILMNYDEHETESGPGPIAGQNWFENNLARMVRIVPLQKIICAIGNYGYDWSLPLSQNGKKASNKVLNVEDLSVQDAWQRADDAGADVHLQGDELNPHFAYDDEDANVRHEVWFLDGVTALNEMRAARDLGIRTFALWRLGIEDPSLWAVWDNPFAANAPQKLETVQPGADVDTEGEGDIMRITQTPRAGQRSIMLSADHSTIIDEHMTTLPRSYVVEYYGYHPKEVALSFDDGPDPTWTPKILHVLNQYHVKATFMVIGEEAVNNVGVLKREWRDGMEIGNHTYTHPDISLISRRQVALQLNLTERLFAAELGVDPLYFRPPYSIDQNPDTNDEAAPAYFVQKMGYIIVGDQIDTNDWNEHPRKTPQEIADSVLSQLQQMKTTPWMRGSIILMHDGGGNRSATVAALPLLINTLRARGYKFVQVSDLMGKTRAEVMPPIKSSQRWQARIDAVAFFFIAFFYRFLIFVFFVGDVLMSGRLLIIGLFALIERFRTRRIPPGVYEPAVAILIPAYNEEKVIVRTIRSALNSDYPHLHVVVIDDGSTDRTLEVAREAYAQEIADGKLTVLTKPNAGKAEALNFGLRQIREEVYVGIDADTVIAVDAVSKLVRHFADPKVGAVAGNAKVGNKVNLWTRWQALEYITGQNFERRALDLFNVVTVVPGAIGAWRTAAVLAGGCYPLNTVAEDADLTMNLVEQGYKVIYEDHALAFTEAPINANGLMRQRFRWSFGTLQAVFKHRQAFRTNRAMGFFALPNIVVFQILLPLASPFIDLLFAVSLIQFLINKHYHPETASAASFDKLLIYFLAFIVIDFFTSLLAFSLEPRHPANKGDGWLLFHIWLQRFSYRQIFSIVLFRTLKRAIDGRPFNWDKLERTAKMSRQTEKIAAGE
ncbi:MULTISPECIES: glycosyltransferase [Acidobacterium]|uniref:Polysaccharide deacetylase domain protein/glycosyl transferase, group 2 family protein n=1 Tax=Acidobacterium capsulatum (strain ATCC 51196 / DSM 11244 / BCRC 80197 / JCM 7670 / NBRC 15755 / NCIMB 13165 / 161) TaxID=240015 RepID=C1F4G9_ACIC5|nr:MULTISPECIES: glycosyltransferase [Acidobacterium]ACO32543.1 polysaccharide deacetylase domain protein/glycosyl transferase, group 2 family protein [Acidobacterium capsulatum ATCC 51196]HCT61794.1 polysaccharide deacetylase [Acidobacterium sp.]